MLDYHREQVAVKDKERESERKWGERWQMAVGSYVSRRKEREEHNRGETLSGKYEAIANSRLA